MRSISCAILQAFVIHYADGRIASPAPWRCALRSVDPPPCNVDRTLAPLAEIEKGGEWTYRCLMRLPDDDVVRPTTLEGTVACIRVSHKLTVDIQHREKGAPEDMITTLTSPVTITTVRFLGSLSSLSLTPRR